MPNWTYNRMKVRGPREDLDKLKALVGEEFDFNGLIPMPDSLNVTSGGRERLAIIAYVANENGGIENLLTKKEAMEFLRSTHEFGFEEKFMMDDIARLQRDIPNMDEEEYNNLLDEGEIYVNNIRNYGASSWYNWRCKNWGTKWPASEVSMDETPYSITWHFDTAWNAPHPIIDKIERDFPNLSFEFWYQNEGDFNHAYGMKYFADNGYEDDEGNWVEFPAPPITNISVSGSDENNWFWDIGLTEGKEYGVTELLSILEKRFLRDDVEAALMQNADCFEMDDDEYKEFVKRVVSIAEEGILYSVTINEARWDLINDAIQEATKKN